MTLEGRLSAALPTIVCMITIVSSELVSSISLVSCNAASTFNSFFGLLQSRSSRYLFFRPCRAASPFFIWKVEPSRSPGA